MKIYISSSWKNRDEVRRLAGSLRALGHDVYDFTDGASRRRWASRLGLREDVTEVPPELYLEKFDPAKHKYSEYLSGLSAYHEAVRCNLAAIRDCDMCVLLLPCGAATPIGAPLWALGRRRVSSVTHQLVSALRHTCGLTRCMTLSKTC